MTPWMYHRLTQRDMGVDLLRPFSFQGSASAAGIVTVTAQIPDERMLLLTSASGYIESGVATSFHGVKLLVGSKNNINDVLAQYSFEGDGGLWVHSGGVGVRRQFSAQANPLMYVPGGSFLYFQATGTGVPAIFLAGYLNGLLVPHGTFSD